MKFSVKLILFLSCLLACLFATGMFAHAEEARMDLKISPVNFKNQEVTIDLKDFASPNIGRNFVLKINDKAVPFSVTEDMSRGQFSTPGDWGRMDVALSDESGTVIATGHSTIISGWLSLLPPLIAIIAAIFSRTVLLALFLGVWSGAWIMLGGGISNIFASFVGVFETHLIDAIYDRDRLMVISFTFMMGGMVSLLASNGGMARIVEVIKKFATSRRRGQLAISSLGLIIFFDDIANTLLIGKTMRPVADRLKISRAKLAYIVDSTAAPLACLAFATTWIGYEVSLIQSVGQGLDGFTENAYSLFLSSIAYSFYPLLALVMVWTIALTGRDFGAMRHAELKAQAGEPKASKTETEGIESAEETHGEEIQGGKHEIFYALIPIGLMVFTLIWVLLTSGDGGDFRTRLGSADSFKALMWASFLGATSAGLFALWGKKKLKLNEVIESWFSGVQATFMAMIVLMLSWAVADVTQALKAADYLVGFLDGEIGLALLPAAIFILAGCTAFATGTSWGTMAILLPLTLPLVWSGIGTVSGQEHLLPMVIAAVLSGAVFGDHCSPISDTTVLSSLASGCDHIEHVATQMPYAVLTAIISILLCSLPVGFGLPWWIGLIAAIIAIIMSVRVLGTKLDTTLTIETTKG